MTPFQIVGVLGVHSVVTIRDLVTGVFLHAATLTMNNDLPANLFKDEIKNRYKYNFFPLMWY